MLPKSLKRSRIKDWLRQEANKQGLRPIDVALTSASKGYEIDNLLELIDKYRKGRDVYVVGVTNVGKSTLINRIIKQQTGISELITTSRFPGTTLDKIEIPLMMVKLNRYTRNYSQATNGTLLNRKIVKVCLSSKRNQA